MSIVDEAIKAAGGALELSKACNLHRTSVLFWRRLKHIPVRHLSAVEAKTGIPREQLRPDLYRHSLPTRPKRAKEPANA